MKKKPKMMLAQTYRKFLSKQSVWIFNLWIRHRDNYKCVICGSKVDPTCGHFVSAKCSLLRYDEVNCNVQCMTCNYIHEYNPIPYTTWMKDKYGYDKVEELGESRGKLHKYSIDELEGICLKYGNDLLDKKIKPEYQKTIKMVIKRIKKYNGEAVN